MPKGAVLEGPFSYMARLAPPTTCHSYCCVIATMQLMERSAEKHAVSF